jgi:hypothetical protein
MQKLASGGAGVPHDGQTRSSWAPHDMQNFAAVGFAVPQLSQVLSMALDRVYGSAPGAPQ